MPLTAYRILVAVIVLLAPLVRYAEARHGSQYANANASLSINLSDDAGTYPFFNWAKNAAGGWLTIAANNSDTGEETALYASFIGTDGYPPSITTGGSCPGGPCPSHTFTKLSFFVSGPADATGSPYFPSGSSSWLLIYDGDDNNGSTNFGYRQGAALVSHSCPGGTGSGASPCIDTLTVTTANGAIVVDLLTTDVNSTGRYVKNIRLVPAAQYNALTSAQKLALSNGAIMFNPDWTAQLSTLRSFRYMKMLNTLGDRNTSWANRSVVNWPFWQDSVKYFAATPLEVTVALANQTHTNMWLTMPCTADDTYLTNAATLVLNSLSSDLKVIVESCNEAWNFGALDATLLATMETNGGVLFPSAPAGTAQATYYYIYRTVKMADLWNAVWVGANNARLTPTMGGQTGNDAGVNQFNLALTTPTQGSGTLWSGTAGSHVKAITNAGYYGFAYPASYGIPTSWTADADGGIQKVYTEIMQGGLLSRTAVSGNCGNGAGKTCTPVDNNHFTVTTGLSLPATPANQMCFSATTNAAGGGTSNAMAADGGTSFPVQGLDGVGVQLLNNTQYTFCFTNQTSAGAVTANWQLAGLEGGSGSEFNSLKVNLQQAKTTANSYGISLIGYEGGQNMTGGQLCYAAQQNCGGTSGSAVLVTLAQNFTQSPLYGAMIQQMLEMMKAVGMVEFHEFQSPSFWTTSGFFTAYWGSAPGTYSALYPGPRHSTLLNYTRRTPCWWAGC